MVFPLILSVFLKEIRYYFSYFQILLGLDHHACLVIQHVSSTAQCRFLLSKQYILHNLGRGTLYFGHYIYAGYCV